MSRRGFCQLTVLWMLGCASGLTPVNPPSFVRPERVAFACVRTNKAGEQQPVPLEQCSPCKGRGEAHDLVALVTQTARGELAAVNLDERSVIDTQTTVPGYSFVPVGESPSAVVVPSQDPRFTFVAHVGSSDVRVLDTASLFGRVAPQGATLASIPIGVTDGGQWRAAEPVDMVLAPDEQHLLFASPRLHGVIAISVDDIVQVVEGTLATADVPQVLVPLAGLESAATITSSTGSDRYAPSCGGLAVQPSRPVADLTLEPAAQEAEPVALAVDAERNRVLVADAALPIIHAIDLDTLSEVVVDGRPPFLTPKPTLDVVISPPVPASPGDVVMERYVYAIDSDRDVLVLNERGVLQAVNAAGGAPSDRLDTDGVAALAIEIVQPGYQGCVPNPVALGSRQLRGVFLTVATVDGFVRVFDVYDMDASLRCTPSTTDDDPVACTTSQPCAAIHRHRPRIDSGFASPSPCVSATVSDDVGGTDSLTSTAGPTLQAVTCATGYVSALDGVNVAGGSRPVRIGCPGTLTPDSANEAIDTRVCMAADPWVMGGNAEAWAAVWEGRVPGVIGSGTLSSANTTLTTDGIDLCAAGVVGGGRYSVELLVEVADKNLREQFLALPGVDIAVDPDAVDCAAFSDVTNNLIPRLLIEVTDATPNALTLGDVVERPAAFDASMSDEEVLDAARVCVAGQRFTFAFRSLDRYTVSGSATGFVHRVRNDNGVCVESEGAVLSGGQATQDGEYNNGVIAFRLSEVDAPPRGFQLTLVPTTAPSMVRLSAGATSRGVQATIINELRYSPIDSRLYAVDTAARGLIPVVLSPFPSSLSSGAVFQ